jgi:hypothetical protein
MEDPGLSSCLSLTSEGFLGVIQPPTLPSAPVMNSRLPLALSHPLTVASLRLSSLATGLGVPGGTSIGDHSLQGPITQRLILRKVHRCRPHHTRL